MPAATDRRCPRLSRWGHALVACTLASGCSAPVMPPTLAMAPDGRSIVFDGAGVGGSDLYRLDLATLRVTVEVRTQHADTDPAFSPMGDKLAFAYADAPWGLAVKSMGAGRSQTAQYTSARPRIGPAFLTGGEIVYVEAGRERPYAFGGFVWDEYDLGLLSKQSAARATARRLTQGRFSQLGAPAVDASSGRIFFKVSADEQNEQTTIRSISARSPATRTLLPTGNAMGRVDVDSQGRWIAFISDSGTSFEYEVWVAKTDGTSPKQMTNDGAHKYCPVFSPSGRDIYFVKERRENSYELWSVNVATRAQRRVAGAALFRKPLRWSRARR